MSVLRLDLLREFACLASNVVFDICCNPNFACQEAYIVEIHCSIVFSNAEKAIIKSVTLSSKSEGRQGPEFKNNAVFNV